MFSANKKHCQKKPQLSLSGGSWSDHLCLHIISTWLLELIVLITSYIIQLFPICPLFNIQLQDCWQSLKKTGPYLTKFDHILQTTFKALHGLAPPYLKYLLTIYEPGCYLLSSNNTLLHISLGRPSRSKPGASLLIFTFLPHHTLAEPHLRVKHGRASCSWIVTTRNLQIQSLGLLKVKVLVLCPVVA